MNNNVRASDDVFNSEGAMLIPIADQQPGIELVCIAATHPCDGHRVFPDAMEVGQGYDTRFYDCPYGQPDDVVCIDGVWHWEVPDFPQPVGV